MLCSSVNLAAQVGQDQRVGGQQRSQCPHHTIQCWTGTQGINTYTSYSVCMAGVKFAILIANYNSMYKSPQARKLTVKSFAGFLLP